MFIITILVDFFVFRLIHLVEFHFVEVGLGRIENLLEYLLNLIGLIIYNLFIGQFVLHLKLLPQWFLLVIRDFHSFSHFLLILPKASGLIPMSFHDLNLELLLFFCFLLVV